MSLHGQLKARAERGRSDLDRDRAILPRLRGADQTSGQEDHPRCARSLRSQVETPETVAARIRRALPHVPAESLIIAPDCGLKYLPRPTAFGKMRAMVEGAAIVRRELARG